LTIIDAKPAILFANNPSRLPAQRQNKPKTDKPRPGTADKIDAFYSELIAYRNAKAYHLQ